MNELDIKKQKKLLYGGANFDLYIIKKDIFLFIFKNLFFVCLLKLSF